MPDKTRDSRFTEDLKSTISTIKSVILDTLVQLDIPVDNPRDVYRILEIDKKLGWKIFNVVSEEDPFLAAQFVPGKVACGKFLRLCSKLGTPPELIKRAKQACKSFEEMVKRHADSRSEFDLMLMSCSSKGKSKAYLSQQKTAFNAYSHLLGVQAVTQLSTWAFHPSDDGVNMDVANIRGFMNFRRNRPKVPWILESSRFIDDKGTVPDRVSPRPLDNQPGRNSDPMEVPFYRRFCSEPLPDVISSVCYAGRVIHELREAPIGNTETTTLITAQIAGNASSRFRTANDRYREVAVRARTPVKKLVLDQLVHMDLLDGPEKPELLVFGEFTGYDWGKPSDMKNPNSILPIEVDVSTHGPGLESAYTPFVPRYLEMLRDAFEKLGWPGHKFVLYRAIIEYPVIPSSVIMRSPLPGRKG